MKRIHLTGPYEQRPESAFIAQRRYRTPLQTFDDVFHRPVRQGFRKEVAVSMCLHHFKSQAIKQTLYVPLPGKYEMVRQAQRIRIIVPGHVRPVTGHQHDFPTGFEALCEFPEKSDRIRQMRENVDERDDVVDVVNGAESPGRYTQPSSFCHLHLGQTGFNPLDTGGRMNEIFQRGRQLSEPGSYVQPAYRAGAQFIIGIQGADTLPEHTHLVAPKTYPAHHIGCPPLRRMNACLGCLIDGLERRAWIDVNEATRPALHGRVTGFFSPKRGVVRPAVWASNLLKCYNHETAYDSYDLVPEPFVQLPVHAGTLKFRPVLPGDYQSNAARPQYHPAL